MNLIFNNTKIKWKSIVWLIITDRVFRVRLRDTIFYALNNYEEKRGYGASDALHFKHDYSHRIAESKND